MAKIREELLLAELRKADDDLGLIPLTQLQELGFESHREALPVAQALLWAEEFGRNVGAARAQLAEAELDLERKRGTMEEARARLERAERRKELSEYRTRDACGLLLALLDHDQAAIVTFLRPYAESQHEGLLVAPLAAIALELGNGRTDDELHEFLERLALTLVLDDEQPPASAE